jgi:hypothetical protein
VFLWYLVLSEAAPEAATRAAGADGKNAVVKAYHSNIIPTESVSTGKKISENSCVIYKRTKSCKYSPFFLLLSNVFNANIFPA